MSCFNKSLTEYKDLKNEFKSDLRVDSIITKWQTLNNTDRYPSVTEAKTFIKNNKTAFNLQTKDFAEAIYGNLKNKGHISKYKGTYFVNNSRKDTWSFDSVILNNNVEAIHRYLRTNNIPKSAYEINYAKNKTVAILEINTSALTPTDILQRSRGFDTPRTRKMIHHLTKLFPGLTVEYLSIPDARRKFEQLPQRQKNKVDFNNVNSFYDPVSGNVVLINSRISDEIAVEEVLHPFVDALFIDNRDLFNNLLAEAKQNFKQLNVEIENTYLDSKGFTQQYRDLELVTQSLSRHFKKEYEENPTKTFKERIKEFLQWFSSIVNDLHRFITGKNIPEFTRDLAYYRGDEALMEQEERFDAVEPTPTIKPGVEELFDSNPELANQVYEVLGFKKSNLELAFNINEADGINITAVSSNQVVGNIELQKRGNNYFVRIVNSSYENQGVATELYKEAIKYATEKNGVLKPDEASAPQVLSIYKKLEKEGLFKIDSVSEQLEDGRYVIEGKSTGILPKTTITPQQKQQALQLYSQYLDTIFPDSQVKDIVYRGDKSKTVNGVKEFLEGRRKRMLYLSTSKDVASNKLYWEDWTEFGGGKNFITAIVNIQSPYELDVKSQRYDEYEIDGKIEQNFEKEAREDKSKDSFIVRNVKEVGGILSNTVAIKKPEQIHILGDKQDIEGFKEFVSKPKQSETKLPITLPNYTIENLTNKDGSKRLAQTDGTRIKINPVKTVEEFFDYFTGKAGGISSEQKKLVLDKLANKDYSLNRIKSILNTVDKVNAFLVLHEQDHIDNRDKDVYWLDGRDLLTPDKVDIETRATINALKVIQGEPTVYSLEIKDINANMTLSDVARMLNTSDIRFDLGARADDNIRYSLTPELQKTVDYAKSQANEIQKARIDSLFNQATATKKEVSSLSAAATGPIVILNEANHKYYNLLDTTEIYKSTTERIKGALSEDDLFNKKLNIDLGNDFDKILQGLASDQSIEELSEMNVLNKEQLTEAYAMLRENLNELTRGGGVAIPQVVVYDEATKTAGTIDILIVLPDGKLRIVDLKTSKNSVRDMIAFEQLKAKAGVKGKLKYDKAYALGENSDLRQFGVDKLSTRAQQGLQVNIYRRMLENMGYEVDMSDFGASTFHIKVGVEGRDADQKFTGEFQSDEWISHPISQNETYVNMLIPSNKNELLVAELEALDKKSDSSLVNFEEELTEEEKQSEKLEEYPEYAAISEALNLYKTALISKKQAIDTINSSVFMDRSKSETKESILHAIASIEIAMLQSPQEKSKLYTGFLRDALRQIESFIEYVKDPDNYSKPEYITYVLNFDRFKNTFQGLYSIKSTEDVNNTQALLITQIQIKLNELALNTNNNQGLINEAILNYVKEQVKNWSNREDLSEDVLNDLLTEVDDIPTWEYLGNDMMTSSDTLLAIAGKIYATKKQELLDRVTERSRSLLSAAKTLQELSTEKNPQKLYDYMLEFDEEGNPTGRYVRRLGKRYFEIQEELRKDFFDENGNWLNYRDVTDLSTASKEDIEFNKALARAKAKYSEFWKAERFTTDGKLVGGRYHSYTAEFKKEREKFEYVVNINGNPIWKRKQSVSDIDYLVYREKYYDKIEYTQAKKKNGEPTGEIVRGAEFYAPKVKYRVANDMDMVTGESLLNEKYEKIMNPTNALERAQKDFYVLYDKYYNEFLEMIPMGERSRMLGRIPVISNNFFDGLKNKPNAVVKLWSKTVNNVKNFVSDTSEQRAVAIDENGNIIDQLPVMYTGNLRKEGDLEKLNQEIEQLKADFKKNKISPRNYKKDLALLQGKYTRLRNTPTKGELSTDLASSLIAFGAMAERYEVMNTVEDTFKAFIKVIEQRTYQPSNPKLRLGTYTKGKFTEKGKQDGARSNVAKRMRKFMSMVFYDNDQITRGFLDKVTDAVISYSSLSYVAFNPFGNFNNYVIGRVNNRIEAIGQRFFSHKSYLRAEYEFIKRAIPDTIHRLSSTAETLAGKAGVVSRSDYDPQEPSSKYEALVALFRMMDTKSEIRESQMGTPLAGKTWFKMAADFGYVFQDAAEYNVQTKVGMAIVMDTQIMNKNTGDILSLYDAFEFDNETKSAKLKDGYDTIVTLDRKNVDENGNPKILKEQEYNQNFLYNLHIKIREVNKEIHGNYARDDRMVIQSYTIGKLAAQFHKWVVPAIKARFRREYFDENLGWMEGRYLSFWKFLGYSVREIAKANTEFTKYGEGFKEIYGEEKLFNTYRTLGEIGMILSTIAINTLLTSLFADDDDDSDLKKRLENVMLYQADRTYKELILFTPTLGGLTQQYQMVKSPVASTRTLGELAEALAKTVETPIAYATMSKDEFRASSNIYYQRTFRKGQLKLKKEWQDAVPILYSFKKWNNYLNLSDFYIK